MNIDLHSHVIPPRVVEAIRSRPEDYSARLVTDGDSTRVVHDQGYVYPLFDEFCQAEAKLESMDRKGIDVSVISPAPPMFYYWANAELALGMARLVNDGLADMVAHHPARLRGMATVPMQHPDAAVDELERVVKEYGFRAIEVGTSIEGEQLAAGRFRPVLKRAAELGVFVFAHPYYVGKKPGLESYYLTNLLGNPMDTAVCVSNLIYSGVMDEIPELQVLLAHGGGFLPYQIGRLVHGQKVRTETQEFTTSNAKELLKRFYFDSLVFEPQALRYLIDLVGSDHVAIGTDSPFDMADQRPLDTLCQVPNLTDREHHDICCGTALHLLGEGRGKLT